MRDATLCEEIVSLLDHCSKSTSSVTSANRSITKILALQSRVEVNDDEQSTVPTFYLFLFSFSPSLMIIKSCFRQQCIFLLPERAYASVQPPLNRGSSCISLSAESTDSRILLGLRLLYAGVLVDVLIKVNPASPFTSSRWS